MRKVIALFAGVLLSLAAVSETVEWINIEPRADAPSVVASDGGSVLARFRHSLASAAMSFWTALRSGFVIIAK